MPHFHSNRNVASTGKMMVTNSTVTGGGVGVSGATPPKFNYLRKSESAASKTLPFSSTTSVPASVSFLSSYSSSDDRGGDDDDDDDDNK